MRRAQHSSMKCAAFSALSENRMPLLRDDPDRVAHQPREAADQRRAVARLVLVEVAVVHEPGDHLAHVELAGADRAGSGRTAQPDRRAAAAAAARPTADLRRAPWRFADDPPRDRQRVLVVLGEVVGHAGEAGVDVGAAKLLGRDVLAGRRLHQRRAAQEDRAGAVAR